MKSIFNAIRVVFAIFIIFMPVAILGQELSAPDTSATTAATHVNGRLRRAVALAGVYGPEGISGTGDLLFPHDSRKLDPNRVSPCRPDNYQPSFGEHPSNLQIIKESGATWVRLWIYWPGVQPTKSAIKEEEYLANIDTQIKCAKSEGQGVILTSVGFPTWANGYDPANPKYLPKTDGDKNNRKPENMVSTNVATNSDWGRWIRFLVERYGYTNQKRIAGNPEYHRYVNFLELCNEANLDSVMWPQRDLEHPSLLVMPGKVADMFVSAQKIVEARNKFLKTADLIGETQTTIKLAGPGTSDTEITDSRKTSYQRFIETLLLELRRRHFDAQNFFAISHHNYKDIEQERKTRPCRVFNDNCYDTFTVVNSAAWVRNKIVSGIKVGGSVYKWTGWRDGEPHPSILITEGGARLHVVNRDHYGCDLNTENCRIMVKDTHRDLVLSNFRVLYRGSLSEGQGMVTNYLTYTDPCFDTGLFDNLFMCDDPDVNAPSWKKRAEQCVAGKTTPPNVCTGEGGQPRALFERWKSLPSAR